MKTKFIVALALAAGIGAGAVTYTVLSSPRAASVSSLRGGAGQEDGAAVLANVNGDDGVTAPSDVNLDPAAAVPTDTATAPTAPAPVPTPNVRAPRGEGGDDRGEREDGEGEDGEDGGRGGFIPPRTNPTPAPATTSAPKPATTPAPKSYSLADVAKHGSASSCWSAINGLVYDLTSWIAQHPGGEGAILSICGADGSAAFNGQHGGRSGPANILAGYDIGVLK